MYILHTFVNLLNFFLSISAARSQEITLSQVVGVKGKAHLMKRYLYCRCDQTLCIKLVIHYYLLSCIWKFMKEITFNWTFTLTKEEISPCFKMNESQ